MSPTVSHQTGGDCHPGELRVRHEISEPFYNAMTRRRMIRSRWVLALSLLFSILAVSFGVWIVLAAYGVIGDYGIYTGTLYGRTLARSAY